MIQLMLNYILVCGAQNMGCYQLVFLHPAPGMSMLILFPSASDCAPVCRYWPPCLRFLTAGITVGFFRFSCVLPGPLCCSSGPCGEDRVPVSRLYWRGGSCERRDHVHLRALVGSAGQSHGGEHPHR